LYSSFQLQEIFTGASLKDFRPNIKHDYLVHFLKNNLQHINHLSGQSVDAAEKCNYVKCPISAGNPHLKTVASSDSSIASNSQ
jgi:hypothetical protein